MSGAGSRPGSGGRERISTLLALALAAVLAPVPAPVGGAALIMGAPLAAQEPGEPGESGEPRRSVRQDTIRSYELAQVERVGSSDAAIDRRLARLLESNPLVVTRDTLLSAADTVDRSVLVLDATLIHEGVISGDLVLVDAGAFVRPGAVVGGDLVNVAGGLYRSEVARIRGAIVDVPLAKYRVVREPDRIRIEAAGAASPLELDGYWGFHPPLYDRVNGVTAVWGATYHFPPLGELSSALHGEGGWLTERGEPVWSTDLTLTWRGTSLSGGHEEGWATNERWIRGDLRNSLNYLWDGRDRRDYYGSERSWVGVARALGDPEKRFHGTLRVRGQVQDATTLVADDPWHLWGDSARAANRPVDEGRVSSVVAGFETEWRGLETAFDGWVEYEGAREWLDGDFAFDLLSTGGEWAMHALADHTLEIEFYGQVPVAGDPLPRQRWSFIGGSGTLRTLPFAAYQGDHVAYVESAYIIPLPKRLALPVLGAPEIQLLHAAGMAWTEVDERDLEQEIGVRLQFFGAYLRYLVVPDGSRDPDFSVGLSWPFDERHPWEGR